MKRNNTVEKIIRQQEKDREMTKLKLEQKAQNIHRLQQEKNSNKWQIEKQKIIDEFEIMKKTGKLNYKTLTKMGIEIPTKKEIKENLKAKGTRSGFNRSMSSSMGGSQKVLHSNSEKKSSTVRPENNDINVKNKKPDEPKKDKINNEKELNTKSKSKADFKDNNNPKPVKPIVPKNKVIPPEKFKESPYVQNKKGQKHSPNPNNSKPTAAPTPSDKSSETAVKPKITTTIRKNSVAASAKSGGNTKRSQDSSGMQFVIS